MTSGLQSRGDCKLVNVLRNRGGQIFCSALKKSLCINAEFGKRVARNCSNTAPIVAQPKDVQRKGSLLKHRSEQLTINRFNDGQSFGLDAPNQKRDCLKIDPDFCNLAIEKFFCLPTFEHQTSEMFSSTPAGIKDQDMFLFVDLKRFLPRNANSVAYGVLFRERINM